MMRRAVPIIDSLADLLAFEAQVDRELTGIDLTYERETRYAQLGAHDAVPTYYFVLDELFAHCAFDEDSHLLDVGCSTGRVLAHFLRTGLPGRATGVELDPELAAVAQSWTARHPNLNVLQANALDLDLNPFTAFYLFNPFSTSVLQSFIEAIELQMTHACTVIHMSDNGDTWRYVGRPGWTEIASGRIQSLQNARGYQVKVYDDPQHYTVWRYDPDS